MENEKRTRSLEIRDILGISRAEFCRRYGIPRRTIEDWDSGRRVPPEWLMALLERVVREDLAIAETQKRTGKS